MEESYASNYQPPALASWTDRNAIIVADSFQETETIQFAILVPVS